MHTLTRCLVAGALVAFAAAAPALADDAAPNSPVTGNVAIIGFSGVFADNYQKFVIAPFEAKYPGIHVTFQQAKNSADMLAQLTLQKGDPQIDVTLIDVAVALRADKEGLFARLDPKIVANLSQMPDWARMSNDQTVAFSQDNLAILYNTDAVKSPPTSWADLADPKYKGKIAAPLADTRGVILIPILDKLAGADYKQTVDPAFDLLKKIALNVQTWNPAPDCYVPVQSGQVELSICWNGRAQYLHDAQGGKIGISLPKEGSIGQTNTINLVTGSKHAEAAQLFINYAISAEAQATFAQKSFYGPVNTTVKLDDATAARIYGSKEAQANQSSLDWPWIANVYTPWVTRIKRDVIAAN
ncbi:MAG: ABC transporter substrate-binding protein [Devosia sp.]|nr:ABC transporter substrate-binding protein [Devosia sp.]